MGVLQSIYKVAKHILLVSHDTGLRILHTKFIYRMDLSAIVLSLNTPENIPT